MRTMHPSRTIVRTLLLTLGLALASCGEQPTLEPPDVRWGQDVCAECGMILSDERFAAAVVAIHEGERQEYLYDDIGEMLAHPPSTMGVSRQWVRDMRLRQWIHADTAHYVRSGRLHTPMGYGIAALADPQEARSLRDETGGDLLTRREVSGTAAAEHHAAPHDPHLHVTPAGDAP